MGSKEETSAIDIDGETSWTVARSYAALLNPIPSIISNAVQLLWGDHMLQRQSGKLLLRATTLAQLRMIEKSGKLKAPVYFAALALYPDQFTKVAEDDVIKALVNVMGPGMLSVILSLVYLHRRLNKICVDTQWDSLSKEMVLNMELGYLVGSTVPKLGPADGMLAGGIRYPALATFLIRTPDPFKRYRNLKKRQFDIPHEHSIWSCDHSQVASYTLKELGFSHDLRKNSHALRKLDDNQMCTLPPELTPWRDALRFIDAIKSGTDPGQYSGALKLSPEELSNLRGKTELLFKGQSAFGWMFKASKVDAEEPKEPPKE